MDEPLAKATHSAGLVALLAACTAHEAHATPPPEVSLQREFAVFLDDRRIGTHRFEVLSSAAGTTLVHSVASFAVKILGIPAYRYHHQAEEAWRGGCLESLSAATDDNGRQLRVQAHREGAVLHVHGGGGDRELAGCVMSYAYWDPRILQQAQLLNPQTGQIDAVAVEPLESQLLTLQGQAIRAQRYRLSSSRLRLDLWYSPEGQWLQLDSTTQDGKHLHYRLQ